MQQGSFGAEISADTSCTIDNANELNHEKRVMHCMWSTDCRCQIFYFMTGDVEEKGGILKAPKWVFLRSRKSMETEKSALKKYIAE